MDSLRARAGDRGHDQIVVYADREHSANLVFLIGFDPRLEEAVLVIGSASEALLLGGALNCRAGFVVESAEELPSEIGDYIDRLVIPYFRAVIEWYERFTQARLGECSRRSSTATSAIRSSASS